MEANINIPGYNLKRLLGRGGMAAVYLAIQESFGREVALKILAPQHADKDFSERFLREARIVSRLMHPNIVTVYDVGIHEGYHYLSMEYIPGKDLAQAHGEISRVRAVQIIKEVAAALDFAGNQGYIHRDVKPENIMLHNDGRVFLMDFGIARGHDSTKGMTQTGKAIGTPYYMSPEQTKGLNVDRRSDIYSLGVVLYQMLAGYVPYDAPSAVAVGIKHLSAPIPTLPESLNFLQPIINTCLSKNPDHRYQTASELATALDSIPEQQLAEIDTNAKAFRQAGQDHNAATMIGDALPDTANSPAVATPSPPPRASRSTSATQVVHPGRYPKKQEETVSKSRGRPVLFFLLLITVSGAAAYLKQEELKQLWHNQLQPYIAQLGNSGSTTVPVEKTPSSDITDDVPAVAESAPTTEDSAAESEPGSDAIENIQTGVESVYAVPELDPSLTPLQQIRKLNRDLDNSPQNAILLAKLYKDMLKADPKNPIAREGILDLRNWYTQRIRSAVDKNNVTDARQLLGMMKESFPRAAKNPRFQRLEQRLLSTDSVLAHLDNAEAYINPAMSTEDATKALAEVALAENIGSEHPAINQTRQKLAGIFLSQAEQDKNNGKFQDALRKTETGLIAWKNDFRLTDLHKQLIEDIRLEEKLASQLQSGDKLFKSGKLIKPASGNAYDIYKKVLGSQKGNRRALEGLEKIQQAMLQQANSAISASKFDLASTRIKAIRQRFGKSDALQQTAKKLTQAINASLPKITRILFSHTNLTSLDQPQPDKLQLVRTVHIGFHFKNFSMDSTLLQATLSGGAGQVKIAQKPVIVTGNEGDHFFDIELPVEGFANGSYMFELTLGDKRLNGATFRVDNVPKL